MFYFIQVKRFYKFLLEGVPGYEKIIPVYHQWFIPCVRHWLKEYQHSAMLFVNNAWDDDKNNDKVHSTFSSHLFSPRGVPWTSYVLYTFFIDLFIYYDYTRIFRKLHVCTVVTIKRQVQQHHWIGHWIYRLLMSTMPKYGEKQNTSKRNFQENGNRTWWTI